MVRYLLISKVVLTKNETTGKQRKNNIIITPFAGGMVAVTTSIIAEVIIIQAMNDDDFFLPRSSTAEASNPRNKGCRLLGVGYNYRTSADSGNRGDKFIDYWYLAAGGLSNMVMVVL